MTRKNGTNRMIGTNVTIVVDDGVLRRARKRALEDETSISAEVREFLRRYADPGSGFEGFLALSEQLGAAKGTARRES